MSEEAVIPIDIPNTLLQKARILNKDTIGSKYDFVKHQGNQFIQVEPASAKFAGYEINKLNTIKIMVINKASVSQRINVLPLESNTFSVKMNKKGLLPTGIAEEIHISFKPTEYRYFYDTLRINTETENILVPIHAYPVLDRQNIRNVFPRLIDFGTVIIGEQSSIVSELVCKIPINFEFEFFLNDKSGDIKIEPQSGIIPASSQIPINLTYTPSANTTLVIDAELRISQFEFEPLKIRLMGSGRYADPAANKAKTLKQQNQQTRRPSGTQKLDPISAESQRATAAVVAALQGSGVPPTDLAASLAVSQIPANLLASQMNNNANTPQATRKVRPLSEKSFKVRGVNLSQSMPIRTINNNNRSEVKDENNESMVAGTMKPFGSSTMINRQQNEREFIEKCNAVQLMDKNKEIKFFQCVGDEEITEQETENIKSERQNFHLSTSNAIHDQGIHRYSLVRNGDSVMTDPRSTTLVSNCTWDTDKNDNLKPRRLVLQRFMLVATRLIMKIRLENRLMSLKSLLESCATKKDAKSLVAKDWQKAEYAGIGQKEFIAFEFSLDEDSIETPLLPIQYEASNQLMEINFPVQPRSNFIDLDLHEFPLFPRNEVETMRYNNIERPQYPNHLPLEDHRVSRTGAEWEYSYNGKPDGKNIKVASEGSLGVPILSETQARQFLKPMEVAPFTFITSHETLRAYVGTKYDYMESDPEYFLSASGQLEIQDGLDPKSSGEFFALKNEFFGKTPGLHSRFALYSIQAETLDYLPRRLNLPKDCGNVKKLERECPSQMKETEYDDNLTDEDSDGEENPTILIQDVNEFLKQLEEKDSVMQSVRNQNNERLPFDELETITKTAATNLKANKLSQVTTFPSLTANYNRYIEGNADKLIIL